MKSTDKNIEEVKITLEADNTLIADIGSDMLQLMNQELNWLDAAGKTVVITDPYLYNSRGDRTYIAKVIDIITAIKASSIIYVTSKAVQDSGMENQVIASLSAQGCKYENKPSPEFHDRYWICVESKKAITTGTSLNGIGNKISAINRVSTEDTTELINILRTQNVI